MCVPASQCEHWFASTAFAAMTWRRSGAWRRAGSCSSLDLMESELNRRRFLAGSVSLPFFAAAKGPDGPYFAGARQFLDTMIAKGTDRFGRKQTPVFSLALDPETHRPPKAP